MPVEVMDKTMKNMNTHAGSSAVYGMGLIGALIYFLQHATTLSQGLLGIVKAIFWPAFFVLKIFEYLKV